jgi:hypothetical protein
MTGLILDSPRARTAPSASRSRAARATASGLGLVALMAASLAGTAAKAQTPPPRVPDLHERSGLLMRFVDVPGRLPPDPLRDNFYGTRYADRGPVKHLDGIKDQGLYGMGWKARCTQSVYPFFYGNPGASTVGPECRPGHRSLRYLQGLVHPFKPVGMYYQEGTYVPIYDLDPNVPGPGPFPYPFYFNWNKGG